MPSPGGTQDSSSVSTGRYTPASLDFINRPNPVEPHAVPQKHPLHSGNRLNQTQDLRRLLLDPSSAPNPTPGEDSVKRRKVDDGTSLDLPRLPVRSGNASTRRTRLPPTLSGLHQPPPNAGILPSIFDQPQQTPDKPIVDQPTNEVESPLPTSSVTTTTPEETPFIVTPFIPSSAEQGKSRRNKWSSEETADLVKGVARFGIGCWTKILKCSDYHFERRTALDLKDRFRVCCPEQYHGSKTGDLPEAEKSKLRPANSRKGRSHRLDDKALVDLGIDQPLPRNGRRRRHGYTAAEDASLLKGFGRHGKSWASIQQDADLGLAHRTPTDLRDRFRQRFSEEYTKAGLTPRPEVFPRPPDRGSKTAEASPDDIQKVGKETTVAPELPISDDGGLKKAAKHPASSKVSQPLHFTPDDVFFGLPFNEEDLESGPVVLDRGILDWALDSNPRSSAADSGRANTEPSSSHRPPASQLQQAPSNSATLPSLAAITMLPFGQEESNDQFELPSLMQYFGSMDGDSRGVGLVIPPLEELLG